MEKIIKLIREKQLLCFFLLAFIISWIIWFLSPEITNNPDIQKVINMIGAFGPALAALIVSCTIGINTQATPTLRYWLFFTISFIVVFGINILSLRFLNIPGETEIYILMGIIALFAAIIFTGPLSKNRGIKRLLKPIKRFKVEFKWYFVVIFLLPLITAIAVLVDIFVLGGQFDRNFYAEPWYQFIYRSLIMFFALSVFGGSLNEEPGWRGFALPRLLLRYNPLVASIILGFIWSLWHAPLHFNGFYMDGIVGFLARFVWNIPLTILFTWIYMQTKGSLLHVLLLHSSINTVGLYVPLSSGAGLILVIILVIILVYVIIKNRMWIKRNPYGPVAKMR